MEKQRKEEELTNESSMIVGRNHLFANGIKIYLKCGFCSDFYLRGSLSHSCFLKSTDSIFGNKSRRSITIKHNIFYYDIESRLETYFECKVKFNLTMKEG